MGCIGRLFPVGEVKPCIYPEYRPANCAICPAYKDYPGYMG